MKTVKDSIKVGHVGVDIIEDDGHINFKPFCVRYDGQGTTNTFDYANACLLKEILEEALKKHLQY